MSKLFENIFENTDQKTGDYVLDSLNEMTQNKLVYFAIIPEGYHQENKYPVNSFFSWRGSYTEPSIWSEGDTVYTCEELIVKLEEFFESVQDGYKGGKFPMYSHDPLWCDPYGSAREFGVTGVVEDEDYIFIIVDQCKY